jgi:hypothetical protein
MNRRTHIEDDGAEILAGTEAPSSPARRAGLTAEIIPFPSLLPPPWAGDDEDADCWESVGVLAVKLVGNFNLPKLLVVRQDQS